MAAEFLFSWWRCYDPGTYVHVWFHVFHREYDFCLQLKCLHVSHPIVTRGYQLQRVVSILPVCMYSMCCPQSLCGSLAVCPSMLIPCLLSLLTSHFLFFPSRLWSFVCAVSTLVIFYCFSGSLVVLDLTLVVKLTYFDSLSVPIVVSLCSFTILGVCQLFYDSGANYDIVTQREN